MRILIAGATGAIGRPVVRRLRANQHEVFAFTRSPDSAPGLKEIGAEPVIADALDGFKFKIGRMGVGIEDRMNLAGQTAS